jgi:hypothetical protein
MRGFAVRRSLESLKAGIHRVGYVRLDGKMHPVAWCNKKGLRDMVGTFGDDIQKVVPMTQAMARRRTLKRVS